MDLSRRANTRESKNAYLVLCRGVHEEHYLYWAIRALEHSHVHVLRFGEGSELDMIKKAKQIADDARAKSSTYDEVWCVFSSTTIDSSLEAAANQMGVRLARSWPTFDLWLLLHFLATKDEVEVQRIEVMLGSHMPDLDSSPTESLERLSGKFESASALADHLDKAGLDVGTEVHLLVESIRDSLRRFYAEEGPRPI